MPVAEREGSRGQVLRGVCSKCETVTKGKTIAGHWLSKCAHPATDYHGRMMAGGSKTIPVIPASVDVGILPVDPRHGVLEVMDPDPGIGGMVDKEEPRERQEPAVLSACDPLAFDVRTSLETIASHARGLSGALVGAQRRIRELEGIVATQAIEGAHLRGEIEDGVEHVGRLMVELNSAQDELARLGLGVGVELDSDQPPKVEDALNAAAEVERVERTGDDFDPDEIRF